MQSDRPRASLWLVAGLLAGLLGAAPASATSVLLTEDLRYHRNIGQPCDETSCGAPFDITDTPPVPFGPWNQPYQSSTVGTLQMQGSGNGTSWSDYGWNEEISVFEVGFIVQDPTEVHLYGLLDAWVDFGWPEAGVRLSDTGGALFEQIVNDTLYEDGSFDVTLVLGPGAHTLRVWADGGVPTADASFDFTFDISPLVAPEPGSAALLAFGLAAIALRRGVRRP